MSRTRQRPYQVWGVFDTETSHVDAGNEESPSISMLYIFNDVRDIPIHTYTLDDPRERVIFYRTEAEAVDHITRMAYDGMEVGVIPVLCVYNAIFDLQTIMESLHGLYDMEVNAQSSTNIYTLDLLQDGKKVLRIWDTYHLEMGGLKAMGATCGIPKLVGDWDYGLVRSPETPITAEELGYAKRDVQVIPAYLRYLCEANDWLTPDMLGCRVITKSSIVRQMARHELGPLKVRTGRGKSMRLDYAFEALCTREMPRTYESYALRAACFRGGLTFTAGAAASRVLRHVVSLDETSAHHFGINGRRVPVEFEPLEPRYLRMWLDDLASYTLDEVLRRYQYPMQRWVHAEVRVRGMRLREGSAFEHWGIALLAQAKFSRKVARSEVTDDNERWIAGEEDIRKRGFADSCEGGVFAFGKLMSADSATVHVTELEWWCMCQVYEWDGYEALRGEGTLKSIWPPDYVTLQSNVLFERKTDAKRIDGTYEEGVPYASDIPASIPDNIARALKAGKPTKDFITSWYKVSVKGSFNGIYGVQAMNLLRPEYLVQTDAELAVNQATKTTPENFEEREEKVRHPMVLYTYGMRIVGGSRMQLVIAIMLLYDALGDRIICTGGDTDSIKIRCDEDVTTSELLAALKPLHDATTRAINTCMARLRRTFPDLASDLDNIGCFEVEPASRCSDFYELHLEAWNKARISLDDCGHWHITCAGLSRPAGAYTIEDWFRDMTARGHDPEKLMPAVLGYNVTLTNDVCHALEHRKPLFADRIDTTMTDYEGHTTEVQAHEAISLYPTSRTMGDTLKQVNADNVTYLRAHGVEVDTTARTVTCVYDLPYALAVCMLGKRLNLAIARDFCRRFRRPALYRQTEWGMEEVRA